MGIIMLLLRESIHQELAKLRAAKKTNVDIIKESLQANSPLHQAMLPDFEQEFDTLMACLLDHYEIDETSIYEKLGLVSHPYFVKGSVGYNPTYVVFNFMTDNFTGSIWLPYVSKFTYHAEASFRYEDGSFERGTGLSRTHELDEAPKWFLDLFITCNEYIDKRNQLILERKKEEFLQLYHNLGVFSIEVIETENPDSEPLIEDPIFWAIVREGYSFVPAILETLKDTHDPRLSILLHCITEKDWEFDIHGQYEDLERYRKASLDPVTFEAYWLKWGRLLRWI